MRVSSLLALIAIFAAGAQAVVKEEHFASDPGWDGFNNQEQPEEWPVVRQGFGYVPTRHAGEAAGEIGGAIRRSSTPAFYALRVDPPLTLKEPVHFQGNVVMAAKGGDVRFGLFNSDELRQGGRPMSSLMFYASGKGAVLGFVRLIGTDNRAAGTMIPPGDKVKESPGIGGLLVRHHFTIDYDPAAHDGRGLVRGIVDALPAGEFEPPAGFKDEPIKFTHFGILNGQRPGSAGEVYFDDVSFNGKEFHFDADPRWESHGNHAIFEDHEPGGFEQYGFATTNYAGTEAGEAGGIIWNRGGRLSYYGDRVGPLALSDRIEASGTVSMRVGGPDSTALLGYFNGDSFKAGKPANVIGVIVTAPTRYGHWFRPIVIDADGNKVLPRDGPVLVPDGTPHPWKLVYHPAAGTLEVTLDGKTATAQVPEKVRSAGATVDHFGLFSGFSGGDQIKLYIDDVKYTAKP